VRSGTVRYERRAAWNIDGMWAWAFAAPAGFMLMIFVLAWLEERIVSPVDRSAQIKVVLERSEPDEIESVVAHMLAPVVPGRHAS
jgi:hypothetical protein